MKPSTAVAPLVAVTLLACSQYGRYADSTPPAGEPTGRRVSPAQVALASSGSSVAQWSNPPRGGAPACGHARQMIGPGEARFEAVPCPDLALQPDRLAPGLAGPPDGARFVADLRTEDVGVAGPLYLQVACGWAGYCLEPRMSPATSREGPAGELVDGLLAELRGQAARLGAELVVEVGCFGRGGPGAARLWCEGRAFAAGGEGGGNDK